jgi:hypothetical protein
VNPNAADSQSDQDADEDAHTGTSRFAATRAMAVYKFRSRNLHLESDRTAEATARSLRVREVSLVQFRFIWRVTDALLC